MKASGFGPLAILSTLFFLCPALRAQSPPPQVWMMPPSANEKDGHILRSLFTHPDDWKETRSKIDAIGGADWVINQQFSDDELRQYLPMIQSWGLKFFLEVGALKQWGKTADASFPRGEKYWDRFISLGGKIDGITMDEPLDFTRKKMPGEPMSYAVEQTAQFIAKVRNKYPGWFIEETETYPTIPVAEHIAWIDALQGRLRELGVRGIDSYRLDVNWAAFELQDLPQNQKKLKGNWAGVKQIEEACRARHLPFDLIYWASPEPSLKKLGLANDLTWYIDIMSQGGAYALLGGKPDIYCIESWVHLPSQAVPETDPASFTHSVIDFSNTFVPGRKP
jgi:hypothetical protein